MIHSCVVSEKALLSTIYKTGFSAYAEIIDLLPNSKAFSVDLNQIIFSVFKHIFEADQSTRLDVPIILTKAAELGFNIFHNDKEAAKHLQSITQFPADKENVRKYAGKILKLDIVRRLKVELIDCSNRLDSVTGSEKISEVISGVETRVLDFGRSVNEEEGLVRIGDYAEDYLEELFVSAKPMGIPTGFKNFDKSIGGGLVPNSLDIVGARTKTGKSLLKNAMMLNIARQGIPVFDVDTEMTREEQIRRLVASISGVPERRIRDGLIKNNQTELDKVRDAYREIAKLPIYHECVAEKNIEQIVASARRWMLTKVGLEAGGAVKPCVVFLDYLKITQSADFSGDNKEYQTLGIFSTAIKNLMAKYSARCVAFVQLNRDGIDREDEGSVAASDRISWYCTSLTILKWLSIDEMAEQSKPIFSHKLIPVLSRHGGRWKTGNSIFVKSNLDCCHMEEGPTREEGGNFGKPI